MKEKTYDVKDLIMTSVAFGLLMMIGTVSIGGYLLYTKKASILSAQTMVGQAASTQEALVTGAIEHANPAVVSIVVTKDVPVLERYYQRIPFGDGTVLRIPQIRQNGTQEKEVGGGSGFIISAIGLIVTNKHVIEDPNASYTVFTNDGKKHEVEIVGRDASLDVAVLKIKGPAPVGGFPYLTFGNSSNLKLGQTAIAIGNALGEFRNSVSVGVISGLARQITAGDGRGRSEELSNVIQTDAAINPGNSGGPLLDLHGQVIGINVAVAGNAENIGFALPADAVKAVVNSMQ
jgi:S1-C subfamily serine protease